jgi:hypothetical protein
MFYYIVENTSQVNLQNISTLIACKEYESWFKIYTYSNPRPKTCYNVCNEVLLRVKWEHFSNKA